MIRDLWFGLMDDGTIRCLGEFETMDDVEDHLEETKQIAIWLFDEHTADIWRNTIRNAMIHYHEFQRKHGYEAIFTQQHNTDMLKEGILR